METFICSTEERRTGTKNLSFQTTRTPGVLLLLIRSSELIRGLAKKLGKLGSGKFYMPHGLTIDDQGNIWVTDVGLHQVMRIPKGDSDPDLVLGHKLEPGSDRTHFCKPTDVAVAKNGDFFVSDGYCNNRIMKFSKKGDFLKQWGSPVGNGGLTGTSFAVPHSLALVEDKDLICVADRENARVMCFSAGLHDNSQTGAFRLQLVEPGTIGRVYAIAYQPTDDVMYAVVDPSEKEARARGYTLGFDGRTPEAWGRVTKADVSLPHDVSVSPDGRSIYLGDIATTPGKAIKYEKTEPNQAQYIF